MSRSPMLNQRNYAGGESNDNSPAQGGTSPILSNQYDENNDLENETDDQDSLRRTREELSLIQREIAALRAKGRRLEAQRRGLASDSSNGQGSQMARNPPVRAGEGAPHRYYERRACSASAEAPRSAGGRSQPSSAIVSEPSGKRSNSARSPQSIHSSQASRYDFNAIQDAYDHGYYNRNNINHPSRPSRSGSVGSQAAQSPFVTSTVYYGTLAAMDNNVFIPSEAERRRRQEMADEMTMANNRSLVTGRRNSSMVSHNYRLMKEAMRQSWENDTTLVGGYFNLRDNPRTSTFGRERRFLPPPGCCSYYLSDDMMKMQRENHRHIHNNTAPQHLTVTTRGREGCNINNSWNTSVGGGAPGPGAYTPRYQKQAPPSRLAQRF